MPEMLLQNLWKTIHTLYIVCVCVCVCDQLVNVDVTCLITVQLNYRANF